MFRILFILLMCISSVLAIAPAINKQKEVKQESTSFDLNYELSKLSLSKSEKEHYDDDIEKLLSQTKEVAIDKSKWLFIIGIEEYDETDNIKYSRRSAELFKKVAQKTLGIDDRRTVFLLNSKASSGKIKDSLEYLLSEEIESGDTVYFYYNGHGVPDPKTKEPYILPSDKNPDYVTNEEDFKLQYIYNKLSRSKAKKVIAFVDSCFSGATDDKSIFKGVAAPRLKPKKVTFNTEKMVVLTAGKDKQFSNMYKSKGHRLFSYYLMKSMLSGEKKIEDIFMDVRVSVRNTSKEFGPAKKQEPTINGNIGLGL